MKYMLCSLDDDTDFLDIDPQLLTIHQIIEGIHAKNLKATILFVDFSKAF